MTAPDVLSCRSLVREFSRGRERRRAVDGLDLSVPSGQVCALIGPNGAGKTTTVRMCSTLLLPTSGSISVLGHDVVRDTRAARQNIGLVLGGERGFYLRASAQENLRFFAAVQGARITRRALSDVLDQVGLADRARSRVETFSRGMVQRLHIARAIVTRPALLLLDEPTIGLDPEVAVEVRSLVRQLVADGTSALLTSHSMREVELLADTIVVIAGGRTLAQGDAQAIGAAAGIGEVSSYLIDDWAESYRSQLLSSPGVRSVDVHARGLMTEVVVAWRSGAVPGSAHLPFLVRGEKTQAAGLEECYLALLADRGGSGTGGAPDSLIDAAS